ncbi:hypothetical protein K443DRAFT_469209 [Laccaria amethystina LaAM-08-1]|uniref:Uncharacterized protein n=1 Tax=Laccaria amethystina LaAM-08-1 TaxID=1095629 RepID=A0A0C9XFC6_9AGAR|nr:hypothetical protein K443DRAFT_469209 [Laccaria amethystina LaAM-08-1]
MFGTCSMHPPSVGPTSAILPSACALPPHRRPPASPRDGLEAFIYCYFRKFNPYPRYHLTHRGYFHTWWSLFCLGHRKLRQQSCSSKYLSFDLPSIV